MRVFDTGHSHRRSSSSAIEIGSRYTRHDQLVAYFNELAKHSDKIRVRADRHAATRAARC